VSELLARSHSRRHEKQNKKTRESKDDCARLVSELSGKKGKGGGRGAGVEGAQPNADRVLRPIALKWGRARKSGQTGVVKDVLGSDELCVTGMSKDRGPARREDLRPFPTDPS
jgi:hypothetical protein